MAKLGTKSYYTKKLDTVFSKYIRARGRCEKCGKTERLHTAHIIPRTNKNLRWDPFNALCLCGGCHIYWQHKNPLEFTEWFKTKYATRYEYLMVNKNQLYKSTAQDLKELYEYYKKKVS